ncbi:serine/threonine-protein kinase [Oryzobacter terrae]|uniref:serine/threonine-protein kinase n=1 Tax=Oryzobacter terrae TaxID=1620385 RepID=UPI0036718E62
MNRLAGGLVLGGRYQLASRIASGGMGDVWEGTDTVLDRSVAVKVLRPGTDEEVFARRFRSEALYAANLAHPNVATVLDYGEDDDLAYLVLELVPGEPLSALVQREGALDPATVRSIVGQAALALGAAHEAGVVHRDVKPANILVTPEGVVKLTDFGIARAVDGSGHTQTGEVLGTPHYLSPEQALGEPATGASDLYALGVVAHEMLTGRRPFDKGTPVATALAQVNEPPPPLPPHVPAGLRALIDQCLAKKPEERPASARELGERLGLPEEDLPAAGPSASTVMGSAELDEAHADERRAAAPTWSGSDPTPTPESTAVVRPPRGHVHWAWVPTISIVVLAVAVAWYGLTH